MQADTVCFLYNPINQAKQCTALASKSNNGARLYYREEMETDQIFTVTEEEIVTGSVIQLAW